MMSNFFHLYTLLIMCQATCWASQSWRSQPSWSCHSSAYIFSYSNLGLPCRKMIFKRIVMLWNPELNKNIMWTLNIFKIKLIFICILKIKRIDFWSGSQGLNLKWCYVNFEQIHVVKVYQDWKHSSPQSNNLMHTALWSSI